jgi:hypothetical protein
MKNIAIPCALPELITELNSVGHWTSNAAIGPKKEATDSPVCAATLDFEK